MNSCLHIDEMHNIPEKLNRYLFTLIRLTSFLWVWFQCVCCLLPSCNTYRLTWVSLTLGVGYLFTAVQHSAAIAPYLGRGVSPHCRPSWSSTWDSSFRPFYASVATAPWTWGWSSWPPPLASGVGLLLKYTYGGNHFTTYMNIKSLCCTSETNMCQLWLKF